MSKRVTGHLTGRHITPSGRQEAGVRPQAFVQTASQNSSPMA